MTTQEAIQIINQLAGSYRGLLQEHANIQEAIKIITEKVNKKADKEQKTMPLHESLPNKGLPSDNPKLRGARIKEK